ncbi:hypothetical protein ccbrp13_14690 [Ktedonobacteria bacterium brp13]|nr:hypothetical protein ccbrp13_14690 [Ktedonobacteria bacterium brp13]
MKTKARRRPPRLPRTYSEAQLAGIKRSTEERRQATVERLRTAIDALKAKKQEISVQTIYDECGLRYAAIHRNPEALALFRANSTNLVAAKKQRKRTSREDRDATPAPRDPLLSYKKPQLVARLRSAQQRLLEVQQQQAALAEARLRQEAKIAELEAKLTVLEPYRTFVEQVRRDMQSKEHGGRWMMDDFGPPTGR